MALEITISIWHLVGFVGGIAIAPLMIYGFTVFQEWFVSDKKKNGL
jgi:hypothetical protein